MQEAEEVHEPSHLMKKVEKAEDACYGGQQKRRSATDLASYCSACPPLWYPDLPPTGLRAPDRDHMHPGSE